MASDKLILVVDDTEDLRDLYMIVLEQSGYRVATAPDGKAGLAMAKELKPDVIMVDMMMPEMDGLEFLERLPGEIKAPPPVVAMSGFDRFKPQALGRGARMFLQKPIDAKDLRNALDAVLSGAAVDQTELRARARVAAHRKHATEQREDFLARVDFGNPDLQAALRTAARWCAGYFDLPIALVDLRRGAKIHVQAGVGDHELREGLDFEHEQFFCSDVVEAASPLLIGDTTASPVFASHPATAFGIRFYAGVPLRTPDGTVFGTLCMVDRAPHVLHGEDLSVLETVADSIARRIAAAGGEKIREAFAFVAPEVVTRDVFHVLVNASLQRIGRSGAAIELAHLDLGADTPAVLHACSRAIYDATERVWLGLARYDHGILTVLAGAATAADARARMRAILSAARDAVPGMRGIGVVTLEADGARLVGPRVLELIADEAMRSARAERGIRRVAMQTESPVEDMAFAPVQEARYRGPQPSR